MNGDGFGAPPWGPADPVPDLADTQAIPGLGSVPDPSGSAAWHGTEGHGQDGGKDDRSASAQDPAADAKDDDAEDGKDTKDTKDTKKAKRHSFWRELGILVVVALVLALLIKSFVVQAFWIPSGSMQNTLAVNDRVLVNKVVYHLRSIHRGDIVVFDGSSSWDAGSPVASSNIFSKAFDELEGIVGISNDPYIYIKRVIGLPGDHVACCNAKGQVTVNGVALSESSYLYPGNQPSTMRFKVTVPAGSLWMMGDHRSISYDSRLHPGAPGGGSIPESAVIGRAFVIIWPPSHWSVLNIPATFEQPQLNASTAAGGNAASGGSAAALAAALDNGTPVRQSASPIPLALGFVGAIPITWLQRKLRLRRKSRRSQR